MTGGKLNKLNNIIKLSLFLHNFVQFSFLKKEDDIFYLGLGYALPPKLTLLPILGSYPEK